MGEDNFFHFYSQKMRKTLSVAALSLVALCSIPASAADLTHQKYQAVYISKVTIEADMDRSSPDEVKYYTDLETESTDLVTKLFKDEGFAILDTPDPANNKLLVINTKAKFNAGNQALRWVAGFAGAGKASTDVTMDAVEPSSGRIVFSQNAQDTMRMGGLGGSAPRFLKSTIDNAWNALLTDIQVTKQ